MSQYTDNLKAIQTKLKTIQKQRDEILKKIEVRQAKIKRLEQSIDHLQKLEEQVASLPS